MRCVERAADAYPEDPILALVAQPSNETGWRGCCIRTTPTTASSSPAMRSRSRTVRERRPRCRSGSTASTRSGLSSTEEFGGASTDAVRPDLSRGRAVLALRTERRQGSSRTVGCTDVPRDLVDSLEPRERPAVTWSHGAAEARGTRTSTTTGSTCGSWIPMDVSWAWSVSTSRRPACRTWPAPPRQPTWPTSIVCGSPSIPVVARSRFSWPTEASSPLARRLSTAQYFAFIRRLVRGTDRCIIDAGGIVGRHAGDGVVAFFLADTAGSESAAASACITAARILQDSLVGLATRSGIAEPGLLLAVRIALGRDAVHGPDPHRRSQRSHRFRRRSERGREESKPARPAADARLESRSSNDSTPTMPTPSDSTLHTWDTRRWPNSPPPPGQSPTRRIVDRCLRGLTNPHRTAVLTRADRADCPRGEPGTPTRAYLPITARQRAQRAEWVCERGLVERRSPCAGLVDRRRARGPCRGEGMRGWLFGGWGLDVWVGRISRATWRRGVLGRASACHAYEGRAHRGRREHARHPTA